MQAAGSAALPTQHASLAQLADLSLLSPARHSLAGLHRLIFLAYNLFRWLNNYFALSEFFELLFVFLKKAAGTKSSRRECRESDGSTKNN